MVAKETAAGTAIYSPFLLNFIYDWVVMGLYFTYAWGAPTSRIGSFFNRNTASAVRAAQASGRRPRVLDIGVGTGYFPGTCESLDADTGVPVDVVLADLNPNCLEAASARVQRLSKIAPRTVQVDFLETDMTAPLAITRERLGGQGFDSISCMMLIHCVPGPPARKAQSLVRLAALLNDEGVLFGTTILGKGVKHNLFGKYLMYMHNLSGIFENRLDDPEGLVGPLNEVFESVEWEVVGKTLFFEARRPKKATV
jgi:SAM-dependent methyltransferase